MGNVAKAQVCLKGKIDGLHDVRMELTLTKDSCSGVVEVLRSQTIFSLSGKRRGDSLYLSESFRNTPSGVLIGTLKGAGKEGKMKFDGLWSDFGRTHGGFWALEEAPCPERQLSGCADERWVRHYQASIKGQNIDIILHKNHHQYVSGSIYFEETKRTYPLGGRFYKNPDSAVVIIDNLEGPPPYDSMHCSIHGTEEIVCECFTPDGKSLRNEFYQRGRLTLGCFEYTDFSSLYDISYPQIPDKPGFNSLVFQFADARIKYYRSQFTSLPQGFNKDLRNARRAYGWSEIAFANDRLVSGLLTYTSTMEDKAVTFDFTFDLTANRLVRLEDLFFVQGTNFFNDVHDYIAQDIKRLPYGRDPDFVKWIEQENFNFFSIQREGIRFYSDHNAFFGRQGITVPYPKLKLYLRPNTVIDNFAK